jgi:hypothetical protein
MGKGRPMKATPNDLGRGHRSRNPEARRGGPAASFIKRPRAGSHPGPEPNPSTGDTPMPELTPQFTPPPDPLIPGHDEPPKNDPPASIPPIIEPKDFGKTSPSPVL